MESKLADFNRGQAGGKSQGKGSGKRGRKGGGKEGGKDGGKGGGKGGGRGGGNPVAPALPPRDTAAATPARTPAAHSQLLELIPLFDETKQFLNKVQTKDSSTPRLEASGLKQQPEIVMLAESGIDTRKVAMTRKFTQLRSDVNDPMGSSKGKGAAVGKGKGGGLGSWTHPRTGVTSRSPLVDSLGRIRIPT